jgi:hypothetical protein
MGRNDASSPNEIESATILGFPEPEETECEACGAIENPEFVEAVYALTEAQARVTALEREREALNSKTHLSLHGGWMAEADRKLVEARKAVTAAEEALEDSIEQDITCDECDGSGTVYANEPSPEQIEAWREE